LITNIQLSTSIQSIKDYESFDRSTNLAAGPPGIKFAITTVGNIDPQPLSTITIPIGSFFPFVTIAYLQKTKIIKCNFHFCL
jgi:hypothetical protein